MLRQQAVLSVSISALARNIGASRVHVIKLVRDSDEQVLLRRPQSGGIILLPPLINDCQELFAFNYLLLSHFAKIVFEHAESVD